MGRQDSDLHIRLPALVKRSLELAAEASGAKLSDYVRLLLEREAQAVAPIEGVAAATRPAPDSDQARAVAELRARLIATTLRAADGRSYPGLEAPADSQDAFLRALRDGRFLRTLRGVDAGILRGWVLSEELSR